MGIAIVYIYNYNTSSNKNGLYSNFIFLSSIDPTDTLNYKIVMIMEFIFMFLILMYLFIYLKDKPKIDSNEVQSLLYIVLPIIYGLSGYLLFLSNNLLQVKFP